MTVVGVVEGVLHVMDGGRDACVGSGGVNEVLLQAPWGYLRALDLPYSFPFFLKFLPNEGGCQG